MKLIKIGFLTLFSFIFSSFSFSQDPKAIEEVLVFTSVASYESYTDDESSWEALRKIAFESSKLTTLAELEEKEVESLYPDFLKEVLNTDYIFQIGDYLIKIDLENNRGLVIAANNTNAYMSLLKDDLTALGMMVLDGDEDFGLELLEALENKETTPDDYQSFLRAERACPGARGKPDKGIETWLETNEQCDINNTYTIGKTYGMDNKLEYRKFIFYFSLWSKIRSVWRCTYGGNWTLAPIYKFVDLKLTGTVKYKRRCETEVKNSVSLEEGYYEGGDGVLSWRSYGGGRSLSHYDFNVDFAIRLATDRNPNPPPYAPSRHYRIVWGY